MRMVGLLSEELYSLRHTSHIFQLPPFMEDLEEEPKEGDDPQAPLLKGVEEGPMVFP